MMIRVNLNPSRKAHAKTSKAPIAVALTIFCAAAIIAAAFIAAGSVESERIAVDNQIAQTQERINEVNKRIAGIKRAQEVRKELEAREKMLARLASFRRGPQFVLNEFARILSNPRDIVARKVASESGWLLAWEPDNIIIKSLKEQGNSEIQIEGTARAMDDVYEFWTRMKTSKIFRNVELVEIKGARESVTGEQAQSFVFRMGANFNYQTKEGLALLDMLTSEQPADGDGAQNGAGSDAKSAQR